MSIQAIIKQLHGQFEPTGAYSFEFVTNDGKSIAELFFLLPPGSIKITEGQRSSLQPTLTGSYITDYGNNAKEIAISGEIWFLYTGDIAGTRTNQSESTVDGFTEYEKLRFMLIRYRDSMMTQGGSLNVPTFSGMADAHALKRWVTQKIHSGEGVLIDQVQVIFHDYDLNNHYYAKIDSFSTTHSKEDINSITYDISMQGYQVAKRKSRKNTFKELKRTPPEVIDAALVQIETLQVPALIEASYPHMDAEQGTYTASQNVLSAVDSIHNAREAIQGGTPIREAFRNNQQYTVYTTATALMENIEGAYIPSEYQAAFTNGDVTLDMFVNDALCTLYTTMLKVTLCNRALMVAVREALAVQTTAFTTLSNPYVIDTDIYENKTASCLTQHTETCNLYTIVQGDTLQKIANTVYGDARTWYEISRANGLIDSNFLDSDLVGTIIQIPIAQTTVYRNTSNLVYEYAFDPDHTDYYTHGGDIETQDGKIIIDGTGDRKITKGVSCTIQNVLQRLQSRKGSLNPLHPEWGVISLADDTKPFVVQLDRVLSDVEEQAASDPRVVSAGVNYRTLEVKNNAVWASIRIELDGGYTQDIGVAL